MKIECLSDNHKGTDCWIKPILCQEGYCSNCQIYLDRRITHGSITPKWFRGWGKEQEGECPELRKIGAGDEIGYMCKLVDKWCLREYGQKCEEYGRIMKEMADESK